MTFHPQCSHTGAIRAIATSKVSVTIPQSLPSFSTRTSPMSSSRIFLAASTSGVSALSVTGFQSSPRALFLPSLRPPWEFLPGSVRNLDAVLLRRRLDPAPGRVALRCADAFDLVETGDRVAHVRRVRQWLLALFRESELGGWRLTLGASA